MDTIIDKKLIVFKSEPDFSDNPRGLWEYIIKNTEYDTFWVIKDQNLLELLRKRGVQCDLEGTETADSMIAKAQFLITSSFYFSYEKKRDQIHVAAWHGFPLKVIGFFDSATAVGSDYETLKIITTQADIITATSRLSQLTLSGMFAVDPRKVKETGYPRNDILFYANAKEELSKITDIDILHSNLILYLPTMRKGLKAEGAQFNDNIFNYPDYDADRLDSFLSKHNAYIFVKMHFADNIFFNKENFKLPKRMIFLNTNVLTEQFLTLYHIMDAFDILITDYSSVYVDFLLLNKPILFSCPDLKQYKEDRGFIVDDPTLLMPGAIVENQNQLMNNITEIFSGVDKFASVRKDKMPFFHHYIDGNSSKRLLEQMEYALNKGVKDSTREIGHCFLDNTSPLYQYMNTDTAEFFFDFGAGFSEKTKKIMRYTTSGYEHLLTFEQEIPEGTKLLRFDPDARGRYVLKKFEVWIDGIPAKYHVVHGYQIEESIVFVGPDPQIVIILNSEKNKKIKIQYYCCDLYSNAGNIVKQLYDKCINLEEQYIRTDEELQDIYLSHSWKWTKPLRKLGDLRKGLKPK